jgi:hypothetical protein
VAPGFSETDAVVVDRVLGPVDLRHHKSTDVFSVHRVPAPPASLAALGEAAYLAACSRWLTRIAEMP